MNWLDILYQVFEVAIIPLLGVAVSFFIKWLDMKAEEIKTKSDNELHKKYIDMLDDTIKQCVTATTQTYVDSIKKQGKFDGEAQQEAFRRTYDAVVSILSKEAEEYLANAFGDLNTYVCQKIEAEVRSQKVIW